MGVVLGTLAVERNRDAAEAATALIITVNRQHDFAVEQAAPQVAKQSEERARRRLRRRRC